MPFKFSFPYSKRKSLFVPFSVQVNKSDPEFWYCWKFNRLPSRSSEEDQLQFSRKFNSLCFKASHKKRQYLFKIIASSNLTAPAFLELAVDLAS